MGQGLGGTGGRESQGGGEQGRGDDEQPSGEAEPGAGKPVLTGAGEPGEPEDATEAAVEADTLESSRPAPAVERESERDQALEQWLARIPETGPGFLREKFLREYRRNPPKKREATPW